MSHPSQPIACTLDPGDMPRRAADIRALGRDALLDVERSERGATLRFRSDAQTRERVDAFVAAESACCPFMEFRVSDDGAATTVRIDAPEQGEDAVGLLTGLFVAAGEDSA